MVLERDGDHPDRSCEKYYERSRRKGTPCIQNKRREVDWIGHSLLRNCLLKRVIEGMIEGKDRSDRKKRERTSATVWQGSERILENERGSSRSQSVEN